MRELEIHTHLISASDLLAKPQYLKASAIPICALDGPVIHPG